MLTNSNGLLIYPHRSDTAADQIDYFIIKSNSAKNVDISMKKNIWSTMVSNEIKLKAAFKVVDTVSSETFQHLCTLFVFVPCRLFFL